MLRPSYSDILEVITQDSEDITIASRYTIVIAAAKRARQLVDHQQPMIDHIEVDKPVSIAVNEIYEGKLKIRVRVIVPFGSRNKKAEGYVISLSEKTEVPADKIKELLEVLDEGRPTFTPALLDLAEWMKERYFCTLNQCLQAIMPPGIRTKSSWTVGRKSLDAETKLTPKETALLALFGERREIPLEEVQAEFGGDCLTFLRKAEGKGLLALKQELHRSEYKNEKRLYSLDRDHPLLEEAWKKAEKEKRLEGQRLLLEYLANGREATVAELKEALGITDSPIKTLLKKGILRERRQTERRNVFDADTVERAAAKRRFICRSLRRF